MRRFLFLITKTIICYLSHFPFLGPYGPKGPRGDPGFRGPQGETGEGGTNSPGIKVKMGAKSLLRPSVIRPMSVTLVLPHVISMVSPSINVVHIL